jgi:UDP-glucose 4-epimerase
MIGIVGASGFIGQHLNAYLTQGGCKLMTLGRAGCQRSITAVETMTGQDWAVAFEGLEAVVYLAAPAHSALAAATYEAQTLGCLPALVEGLKLAGVKRLVYLSSIKAVAGVAPAETLSEDLPPQPEDAYGKTKREAEQFLLSHFAGTVVLRPALVYGRGVKGNLAQLQRFAALPVPLPFQGLSAKRAMVHVQNLCEAIDLGLQNQAMAGQCFLVADKESGYSVAEIIALLRQQQGKKAALFYLPPLLLRGLLAVIGQAKAWPRLNKPLRVSTAKLQAQGYKGHASLRDWH